MAISLSYVFFFFLLVPFSSASTACDGCLHQSTAAHSSNASALQYGSCGYGSLAMELNSGQLAAAAPSLYKNGAGCGACFQVRCRNEKLCSKEGARVMVTGLGNTNTSDFMLNSRAFAAMATAGMSRDILQHGKIDIQYKRVPCEYKNRNLAIRVEESSQKPYYLAIQVLYQGGQTEVVAMEVAQVGSLSWRFMTRSSGAVWSTGRVPEGPMQFRFVVTAGFDGKWVWVKRPLPADWVAGGIYDSGVQITDVARESCSDCDG